VSKPSGTSDPLAVNSQDLAPVLDKWIKIWNIERPSQRFSNDEQGWQQEEKFISAMDYLESQSGINRRRIYDIVNMRQRYVTLRVAERLLMAIDREYMLKTGEIPPIPNPHWSQEYWLEYMRQRGCA
jgi:hypothetical protein